MSVTLLNYVATSNRLLIKKRYELTKRITSIGLAVLSKIDTTKTASFFMKLSYFVESKNYVTILKT